MFIQKLKSRFQGDQIKDEKRYIDCILILTETGMATANEAALMNELEKLTGILNGASDKLDALAASFGTSDEEIAELTEGKTDEEIAEHFGEPLINALDSVNAIMNGVNEEVMDLNLIAELKLYIKEHHKPVSFPNPFSGKERTGQRRLEDFAQGAKLNFREVSGLASSFVKEKHDYADFAHSLDEIREKKGMSPAELYKAAWIDKRLYSKIMATSNYQPAKNTAISFGLALRLKPDEFASFLQKAGYALSYSSIFDLVVRFCVEREIYDLHEVNTLLLQADQKTLAKEAA